MTDLLPPGHGSAEPRELSGAAGYANNLPLQPTPLVGRQQDIDAIRRRLLSPSVRLLTLTGAPGVGKTRLAIGATVNLLAYFRHGIFFIDLAPIPDPALVLPAIGQVLGIKVPDGHPPIEALQRYFENKLVLLLLDNFEHLLAAASQVADLLSSCPSLKILITSRELLRLRWEHAYPVPPLAVPDLSNPPNAETIGAFPAVELFIQRARAVRPDFTFQDENAPLLAEICARLDGIPLAIELAAGECDVLRPQDILVGLERRGLRLLGTSARDVPHRHRTLRAAVDWSYELLDPEERQLLPCLTVFAGGGTIEAVQSICLAPEGAPVDLAKLIVGLVRRSLLYLEEMPGAGLRFRMLEMIRQYGTDQLVETGELEAVKDRHARFFLGLAKQAEPLLAGPGQEDWLVRLDEERDNLRAALSWLRERGEIEQATQLAGALWQFWWIRGYYNEGRSQIEGLLQSLGASTPNAARAKLLLGAGELANYSCDYARARSLHEESLDIYRRLDDKRGVANSLRYLAGTIFFQGDPKRAIPFMEESLSLFRDLGDKPGTAMALNVAGEIILPTGDFARARALTEESLALRTELGDKRGVGAALNNLGTIALMTGNYGEAQPLCKKSLEIWHEIGDLWRIALVLDEFAWLSSAQGSPRRAVRLAGAAAAVRDRFSIPLSELVRATLERGRSAAKQALAQGAYASAWQEGYELDPEEAVRYALHTDEMPALGGSGQRPSTQTDLLSPRERQIAIRVAQGRTNRQIAAELVISERTVDTHVTHILAKLKVRSRAEVAAIVATEGLLH